MTNPDIQAVPKYRDSEGRLIRGNIRSAFFDSDDSVTLYDKEENVVPWPDGWPTVIFPKSFKQIGIEVVT